MDLTANHWMMIAGALALGLGWLLRGWAARHNLVEQAAGAAWDAVRQRDLGVVRDHVKAKADEVAAAGGVIGKAGKVAGVAARHALAQVVSLAGLVAYVAGLALIAAGIWWP